MINVETIAADPFRVYLDLFELRGDPPGLQLVESADEGAVQLEFEPERDGTFVLRLQPELLRGGRFTITEHTTATLTFPIEGRQGRSIVSSFGIRAMRVDANIRASTSSRRAARGWSRPPRDR